MPEVMQKKKISVKIDHFYIFLPLEVKPLTWGQIWQHTPVRAVNGLSFAFFRVALALLDHQLECLKLRIVEMMENPGNFTFGDLCWPDHGPDPLKMTEVLS